MIYAKSVNVEIPNVSCHLFFLILLTDQSGALSLFFLKPILFSGSPEDLCGFLSLSPAPRTLRRLKGTKLDHSDTRDESYPQHKWLRAGLIDKLPLHFISQTDWA